MELLKKIKALEKYLGPRINYTSDVWPRYQPDRWLLEYLDILKKRYYKRKRR